MTVASFCLDYKVLRHIVGSEVIYTHARKSFQCCLKTSLSHSHVSFFLFGCTLRNLLFKRRKSHVEQVLASGESMSVRGVTSWDPAGKAIPLYPCDRPSSGTCGMRKGKSYNQMKMLCILQGSGVTFLGVVGKGVTVCFLLR